MSNSDVLEAIEGIAIIGMSGRFPGARNLAEFWENLKNGVESISFFSEEELIQAGIDPQTVTAAGYVKANGALADVDMFDAPLFGFSPREATLMDPQYRLFMECAWEALENAAYDSETYDGLIGIYGGMSLGHYLIKNLLPNRRLVESEGPLQLRIFNDKDFLASLTAYKLNLKGPSVTVQTACSTSLVAVSLACQSLLNYQCDMALAGGVSISLPQKTGYSAQEGVFSRDGHCRAFDASGQGTVNGNGVGIVALKRLGDAIADGDSILAVIKGSAINNDGSSKIGYTAPSVDGQADVIAMAMALARVEPETITYIEAHGTATPMGDAVEIGALTQVMRESTDRSGFCAIGSVKTNIGHLDAAAGAASLIKVALALKHKQLPPSLHFKEPNPQIAFESTPFYVNAQLSEWGAGMTPRRAGVSAFAVGGVNAHAVLEEAPAVTPSGPSRGWKLLVLSAMTETALETITGNLAAYLTEHPSADLADIAYTLQVGRKALRHRRALVCQDIGDALDVLGARAPKRLLTDVHETRDLQIAFMFPGLGNHYVDMAFELYENESAFREQVDLCCEMLKPHLNEDLRDIIYPGWRKRVGEAQRPQPVLPSDRARLDLRKMVGRDQERPDEAAQKLNQTLYTQPALFVIEYALAKLWMAWGVSPQAMIGYSIGEYVAACLAGVFSLEDALYLVAKRAQMIQTLPGGAMLAVPLSEVAVRPLLSGGISLAAVNGPQVCVVSGPTEAVAQLERRLVEKGLVCRRLQVSHAFHSAEMSAVSEPFSRLMASVELHAPEIPFVSNVTGSWITPAQATDPQYWAEHVCKPVRFGEGIEELWKASNRVLIEVGPGQTLGAWAVQCPASGKALDQPVLSTLRHSYDRQSDLEFLLTALGKLWLAGMPVSWSKLYPQEKRHRIPLPPYPFERKRYWVEPAGETEQVDSAPPEKRPDLADWFYVPSWKQSPPPANLDLDALLNRRPCWLVFADDGGSGASAGQFLGDRGQDVITAQVGERFDKLGDKLYALNPANGSDYSRLLDDLAGLGKSPEMILHFWSVSKPDPAQTRIEFSDQCQALGFTSLLLLAQALGNRETRHPVKIGVVSSNMCDIAGESESHPEKATLLGPCRVIPQEYPGISCRCIDVAIPERGSLGEQEVLQQILTELAKTSDESFVAYRGGRRWVPSYEPVRLPPAEKARARLREGGVYLITGGVGGIGLVLAESIARSVRAKLILAGRSTFPDRQEWERLLASPEADRPLKQKIRRLLAVEELGAEVFVTTTDVTDEGALRGLIGWARDRLGGVNGIIHAAGVSPGGMIQLKTPEMAAGILAPKVKGTLLLDELLKDAPPDFFFLCSSLTSVFGGLGMVDHCAANAFLDAFAQHSFSRRAGAITSIGWDAWLEVGQAANAEIGAGLKRLLQPSAGAPGGHPLLGRRAAQEADYQTYATFLSTPGDWVLDQHRIMGNGALPGTAYIEMARAAFEDQAAGGAIVIEDLLFLSPLIVRDQETREVQTILERNGDIWTFSVVSRSGPDVTAEWRRHATGKIYAVRSEPTIKHDLTEIAKRCDGRQALMAQRAGDYQGANGALSLGPRWRGLLKGLKAGQEELLATLELPEEFSPDLASFAIHPSLMDAATGFIQVAGEGFYLPFAYKKIIIRERLSSRLYSYARYREPSAEKETLACDIIITDENGAELVAIEEYILKRVSNAASLDTRHIAPGEGVQPSVAGASNGGGPDLASGQTGGRPPGISPDEGAEAFARVLSAPFKSPQVLVCARDFATLLKQANRFTRSSILEKMERLQSRRRKHPRPNVKTPFVAPRNGMEAILAEMWQDLLGVDEVGVHDSFFDMGGDSLLTTQLISRMGKAFEVNLSLRSVFDAPTIAELGPVILQKQAEQTDGEALAQMLNEIKSLSGEEIKMMLAAERRSDSEKGQSG